jgi:hypothetical protein
MAQNLLSFFRLWWFLIKGGKMESKINLKKNKNLMRNDRSSNYIEKNFRKQYRVIKDDIIKLRDDLQKGYDMAKEFVEKKIL